MTPFPIPVTYIRIGLGDGIALALALALARELPGGASWARDYMCRADVRYLEFDYCIRSIAHAQLMNNIRRREKGVKQI